MNEPAVKVDPSLAKDAMEFRKVLFGGPFFQTMVAGCEFELFTFLSRNPDRTFDQTVDYLKIQAQPARILLLACCEIGLLRRDAEGRYSNTPLAERFLVRDNPTNALDQIKFNNEVQYKPFYHLTESLRSGTNSGLDLLPGEGNTIYERLASHPRLEEIFHRSMSTAARNAVKPLVAAIRLDDTVRLLDVGGGAGTNALSLRERFPKLRVTVFDFPTVTVLAEQNIAQHGQTASIDVAPGNMFTDPFPTGCDAVLFSHFLEIYSPQKITDLLRKAHMALPENGAVYIWAIAANDEETSGPTAAKTSLYFHAIASGEGMAYPGRDYRRWLEEVGFSKVEVQFMPQIEHALIIGTK